MALLAELPTGTNSKKQVKQWLASFPKLRSMKTPRVQDLPGGSGDKSTISQLSTKDKYLAFHKMTSKERAEWQFLVPRKTLNNLPSHILRTISHNSSNYNIFEGPSLDQLELIKLQLETPAEVYNQGTLRLDRLKGSFKYENWLRCEGSALPRPWPCLAMLYVLQMDCKLFETAPAQAYQRTQLTSLGTDLVLQQRSSRNHRPYPQIQSLLPSYLHSLHVESREIQPRHDLLSQLSHLPCLQQDMLGATRSLPN